MVALQWRGTLAGIVAPTVLLLLQGPGQNSQRGSAVNVAGRAIPRSLVNSSELRRVALQGRT